MFWLLFAACTPEPAEIPWGPPDEAGPFGVGVLTLEFTDPRGKPLVVEVWYPAVVEEGTPPDPYEPTTLTGAAVREAPPEQAGAPWPLVGFSHGFGGIRYQSIFLTERLASHGFVVVAPDHTYNTLLDLDEEMTALVMLERPGDVSSAIDEVIRLSKAGDAVLGGMVEGEVWAATGHSFGAVTALTLGGGELDYSGVEDYCATDDGIACDYLGDVDPSEVEAYPAADERAVVTLPMSPGAWYTFGAEGEGLASVRRPMILGGDKDEVTDYETEIVPTYQHLSPAKSLATFAGAGHYAFSDICRLAPILSEECGGEEAGYIDIDRAQALTQVLVTAFLGLELAGDERYAEWLADDYLSTLPELRVERE